MLFSKQLLSTIHLAVKESAHYAAWPSLLIALITCQSSPAPNVSVTNLVIIPPPAATAIAPARPDAPRLYRL